MLPNQGGNDLSTAPLPIAGEFGSAAAFDFAGKESVSKQCQRPARQPPGGNFVVDVQLHAAEQLRWLKEVLHELDLVDARREEEPREFAQSRIRQGTPTIHVAVPGLVGTG